MTKEAWSSLSITRLLCHRAVVHAADPIKIAWGKMSIHCSRFTLQSVVNSVGKL